MFSRRDGMKLDYPIPTRFHPAGENTYQAFSVAPASKLALMLLLSFVRCRGEYADSVALSGDTVSAPWMEWGCEVECICPALILGIYRETLSASLVPSSV
eukprot:gene25312-biopygen10540